MEWWTTAALVALWVLLLVLGARSGSRAHPPGSLPRSWETHDPPRPPRPRPDEPL